MPFQTYFICFKVHYELLVGLYQDKIQIYLVCFMSPDEPKQVLHPAHIESLRVLNYEIKTGLYLSVEPRSVGRIYAEKDA
jgi:hypothetical protein